MTNYFINIIGCVVVLAFQMTNSMAFAKNSTIGNKERIMMSEDLVDQNHTRLRLVKSVPGNRMFNFLFLPGGPGVDSSCFKDLVESLNVSGNYWLIDLPFNGTNEPESLSRDNICQKWDRFLVEVIREFQNPILVGHSFGGYLPLFCPELEELLQGLIILNSIPTLNSDLFAECTKGYDLPSLIGAQTKFLQNPSVDTLKGLYLLESYYFFSPKNRVLGMENIINKLEFCISTEFWWYTQGPQHFYEIKWIPQSVPTVIVGGTDDLITPLKIFSSDSRFQRHNIDIVNVIDAGHFPWVEKPEAINDIFKSLLNRL